MRTTDVKGKSRVTQKLSYSSTIRSKSRLGLSEIMTVGQHSPPLISVIIPAFNAALTIERTLRCVLCQTYQKLEILVVDDGSEDNTVGIVERLAGQDSRIRLIRNHNSGAAKARNRGIEVAAGAFIAPIDADDLWHSEMLVQLLNSIEKKGSSVGVAYAWSIDIDDDDRPTGGFKASNVQGDVLSTLICHNFLGNASASLIRKHYLEQVGGYDTTFKYRNVEGCEDWDLYLRLAESCEFCVVPQFLVGYRKSDRSMSANFEAMARSHQFLIDRFQLRHPSVGDLFYQLSTSSLYVYFADQSRHFGQIKVSLDWLYRALKVNFVVTLTHPFFYLILFGNLLDLLVALTRSKRRINQPKESSHSQHSSQDRKPRIIASNYGVDSIFRATPGQWLRLQAKLTLSQLLRFSSQLTADIKYSHKR